jgi:hypothetical protein
MFEEYILLFIIGLLQQRKHFVGLCRWRIFFEASFWVAEVAEPLDYTDEKFSQVIKKVGFA